MSMNDKIKDQNWSEFDKMFEDLKAGFLDPVGKPDIKSTFRGEDVMTDAQHRMIIAVFTNELDWTAHDAFNFTLKIIPELRGRLKKRMLKETDIAGMYLQIKKKEASKLINIIKSISQRRKRNA